VSHLITRRGVRHITSRRGVENVDCLFMGSCCVGYKSIHARVRRRTKEEEEAVPSIRNIDELAI